MFDRASRVLGVVGGQSEPCATVSVDILATESTPFLVLFSRHQDGQAT